VRASRAFGAGLSLLGAALFSGCYGGKTFEAVQRIEMQTSEIDSLARIQRADLAQLRQDVAKQNDFLRSTKADTDVRVAELAQRLDVVVGKLEDNNERFSEVLQRYDLGRRPMSAGSAPDTAARDTSSQGPQGVRDPKPLYDAAYQDYSSGRYDLARNGFQQFVNAYSESELAGNAQFWIGETYFQQKEYSEAAAAYQKVLDRYPHNIKVPAALLKLGLSQAGLGNRAAARSTLRKVSADYPGTQESQVAKQKLKTL
jgi:tol-pal system protein YbgF